MSEAIAAGAPNAGGDGKFHFAIDRGGTFTDVYCILPDGSEIVRKLLSVDPMHYNDAPTEGIRRILHEYDSETTGFDYSRKNPKVPTSSIGSIRMGTTVATNALLERQGAKMALLITQGFVDLLQIGNQSRPDIFDLSCKTPKLLYEKVVSIPERVILTQFIDDEDNIAAAASAEEEKEDYFDKTKYPRMKGITGEELIVVQKPDMTYIKQQLEQLRDDGITSLAISLLHSYTYPKHEQEIAELAKSMNCFTHISISSETNPMIKLVPRGHTCCASAYLTPILQDYLNGFCKGFDEQLTSNVSNLCFMKSDGGLTPINQFGGHQAILSGPAGGVVGYAKTTYNPRAASASSSGESQTPQAVIGFDMGGTSTDVSRYDGQHMEHVFETVTAGVAIQA